MNRIQQARRRGHCFPFVARPTSLESFAMAVFDTFFNSLEKRKSERTDFWKYFITGYISKLEISK
jgi:hypothetical protein